MIELQYQNLFSEHIPHTRQDRKYWQKVIQPVIRVVAKLYTMMNKIKKFNRKAAGPHFQHEHKRESYVFTLHAS